MPAASAVLVDTGPLVALFDPSDRDHEPCREALARLEGRELLTSLAVVTEATYLLAFSRQAQGALLTFFAEGAVELAEIGRQDVAEASRLMARYADLPMDFADATLVVLAMRLGVREIFTLDRRGFGVSRLGRKTFRLLPED